MTDETPTTPASPQAFGEKLLPDMLTPISVPSMYLALEGAWTDLVGTDPGRASLLVLIAHWAFETGWGHYCHCYNLGNVKHVKGDGRDYTMFRCNEVVGGKVVWYDPPAPATWFRAFLSLAAGARDYLLLLRGQFGFAWPFVEAGDIPGFCHALKLRGYYTADEQQYTVGVVSCARAADHMIPAEPPVNAQDAMAAKEQAIGESVAEDEETGA